MIKELVAKQIAKAIFKDLKDRSGLCIRTVELEDKETYDEIIETNTEIVKNILESEDM